MAIHGSLKTLTTRMSSPQHLRLANQLLHIETQHQTHQIEALQGLATPASPQQPAEIIYTERITLDHSRSTSETPLPLRTTILLAPTPFGRKLNRTLCFGAENLPDPFAELQYIEDLYHNHGNTPALDVSRAVCDPRAWTLLTDPQSGYEATGEITTFHLPLQSPPTLPQDQTQYPGKPHIEIIRLPKSNRTTPLPAEFTQASISGYLTSSGRPPSLLTDLVRIAAQRADTTLYTARIDGQIAGTGALAYLDTVQTALDTTICSTQGMGGGSKRRVAAYFYLDSTVPAYRGRGVHAALIEARVRDVRASSGHRELSGVHVAGDIGMSEVGAEGDSGDGVVEATMCVAAARTGGASARNFARAGFEAGLETVMFTKVKVGEEGGKGGNGMGD